MADLFDRRINLRDGRALAYVERGHPTGVPVVYCHGVPSSRAEADVHGYTETLATFGIRLIVPDRPGFGCSDIQPNRTVVDWAALSGAGHPRMSGDLLRGRRAPVSAREPLQ